MTPRLWIAVFLGGALAGAALDQVHVQTGTLAYRHPFVLEQAWWVAPQFGAAMVGIMLALTEVPRRLPRVRIDMPQRHMMRVIAAVIFVATYVGSGFAREHAQSFAWVAGGVWLLLLASRRDRVLAAAVSAVLALGGTLYEHSLSATGAFWYARPDIGNVPIWLPVIYLAGGLVATDVLHAISRHAERGPA